MATLNKNTSMGKNGRNAVQDEISEPTLSNPSANLSADENVPVDEQETEDEPGEN